MQTNMTREKTRKTKPSKTLQDALNTSYSVKGHSFVKGKAKHEWTRSNDKRNMIEGE